MSCSCENCNCRTEAQGTSEVHIHRWRGKGIRASRRDTWTCPCGAKTHHPTSQTPCSLCSPS